MANHLKQPSIHSEQLATAYLANERTFLAWIRTSLTIIGLGYVVTRFGLWLRELAAAMDAGVHTNRSALSMPLGVTIMIVGGLVTVLAAWRFHSVNSAIAEGDFRIGSSPVFLLALSVANLCLATICCLFLAEVRP